jgi:hypothetical protein
MTTEYINSTSIIISDMVYTLWMDDNHNQTKNIQTIEFLHKKGIQIDHLPIASLGIDYEDKILLQRAIQGQISYETLHSLAHNLLIYQPFLK